MDLEHALFHIFEDQHQRIDLFVKSKAGEIQRRLDHAKKQLKQLSARNPSTVDRRIPIARLERYGKLENDVLKAGDEIRSLARFAATQRTAFHKLLKKFKKWTGSPKLEARFREEVLDDPQSFTKLDLGPMLDEYSELLHSIRDLYETKVQQAASRQYALQSSSVESSTTVDQLQGALRSISKVNFDTAIATVPLGESGELANYFVHPENVVELQVLLLQHMEYFTSRSRSNSAASPVSISKPETSSSDPAQDADYFMLVADNLTRFAQEQSALTVNEREHLPGLPPQRAKAFVRWNNDEEAVLAARRGFSKIKSASLKRKHIDTFFDKAASLPKNPQITPTMDDQTLNTIRDEVLKDKSIRPLFKISSCRSRFTGINNSSKSFVLATLDTSISMQKVGEGVENNIISTFPFAVLQVRQEGAAASQLLPILGSNHLVERVRGFSLQYHALWQLYHPENISPPFWMSTLSQDIRKLPPPALKPAASGSEGGSGSQSATRRSGSTSNSGLGVADGTTAVEAEQTSSGDVSALLENPPLKSFRKKRHRTYTERETQTRQRYWSEYDHPVDGQEGSDAYVIYIDPNEKSTIDRLLDKLGRLFIPRRQPDEESLLPSPATANDDETSDEEEAILPQESSYGTIAQPTSASRSHLSSHRHSGFFPQITSICLAASVAISTVAYILTTTSKHKYAAEVDAGTVLAIVCSLAFAVIGFIPLLGRRNGSWSALTAAAIVVILDAIFSGFLLAWILG